MEITEEQLKVLKAAHEVALSSMSYLWGTPTPKEIQKAMDTISYAAGLIKVTCAHIESQPQK